jgi:hypothetical protein
MGLKFKKPCFKKYCGITIKIFNQDLKDHYEKIPRKFIKESLGKTYVKDNDNIYGEDMVLLKDDLSFKYIELQVYGNWINKYPFEKPYVFERKMRLSENTLFICFNKDYSKIILFLKDKLKDRKKFNNNGEYIYTIDWNDTIVIDSCDLSMKFLDTYFKKN